jgi:hypothetical protein
MTPQVERLWRILLWGGTALLGVGSLSLVVFATFYPRPPRPLPAVSVAAVPGAPKLSAKEIETFARKLMSRSIVKPAPPPPPKPVLPPLDMVVRLSGIIDYGPDSPREAFIEIRQTSQTKSYRVGDPLPAIGAVVKGIADGVVMEYDGKLWKLTDRGVTPAAIDPVTTSGTKP